MCTRKYLIIITLSLIGIIPAYSQKEQAEICIDFRVNSIVIDTLYHDNAERLDEILYHINQLRSDTTRNIMQVTFSGVASPEGNSQLNKRLAANRLLALEKYIRSHIALPEGLIVRHNDTYIPWTYLIAEVEASDIPQKEEILSILHQPSELVPHYNNSTIDRRVLLLQKLDNGKVWRILNERFFPKMRNACFVLITLKDIQRQSAMPVPKSSLAIPMPTMDIPILEPIEVPMLPIEETEEWIRHIHLKTNTIGLALAMANIAIEVDLAKHWSFTLPVYYSAWNYFKPTIKFRTQCIQPEFRYWFSEKNDGFFTGVHLEVAYYNFAFDGDYRYQSHNGERPAFGSGISIGYRNPLGKSHRWKMEFSLGAGVYSLHSDKFYNTPQTKDGLMIESIKETYWGIDQIAVSLSYTFDLKKKGDKR